MITKLLHKMDSKMAVQNKILFPYLQMVAKFKCIQTFDFITVMTKGNN